MINRHYVSTYLRPLSLINIGTESGIEKKAEAVETIHSNTGLVSFEQRNPVPIWWFEPTDSWEYGDFEFVEDGNEEIKKKEVIHPDRHWWIISNGLLESSEPTFQSHADVFDFILALNICIEDPVLFSQSPGQTEGGAYRVRDGALDYRGDLSPGNFALALSARQEIPEQVSIQGDISKTYEMVRTFRAMSVDEDEDMDIRVALHLFDDALKSTIWTSIANLYYVCENVLCTGDMRGREKDNRIAEVTSLNEDEAMEWRKMVNRLKHPDKGPGITGILDGSISWPSPVEMRIASNDALMHEMRNRYEEIE